MALIGNPVTILLVDDDAALRRFARSILVREGFHVIEAADGAEALEIASAYADAVHLLVTDVIMPKVDGLVLAQRILRQRPDIGVIYMSGYVEGSMLAAKQPASILVPKPFNPKRLITAVRHVLDLIREQQASA